MSSFEFIGKSLRREEDARFLTGLGEYTADLHFDDCAYLAVVRSPHAHARILGIEKADAEQMPGVLAVLDAQRWVEHGLPLRTPVEIVVDFEDGRPMNCVNRPIFAAQKVCHVGDTVAMVIATTQHIAVEAAERVEVTYEELPSVIETQSAREPTSSIVHEQFASNLAFTAREGCVAEVERYFDIASHVTSLDVRIPRVTGNPIETRTYVGCYDRRRQRYTLYASTQLPHLTRRWLTDLIFDLPRDRVRVIAPDVGGGFGTKAYFYPELPVVMFAARLTGRPVRYCATRTESLQSDCHARDMLFRGRMAFDERGKILAVDMDVTASLGAYQSNFGALPIRRMISMPANIYDVANAHGFVTGVFTNAAPTDAYRGVGEPPVTACERLIENGARELGLDPMELRTRNYIQPDMYPYQSALLEIYDSGNPPAQQAKLLEMADYDGLRAEQTVLKASGERIGIGAAAFVDRAGTGASRAGNPESGGSGTWEAGRVEVYPDGRALISVGTHSHGQGHEITFRQIVAEKLNIPIERIAFQQGDTDRDPGNFGTGAQRSLVTAGMALLEASERVIRKASVLAAHLLEAAEADVGYENGRFIILGTDRGLDFAEVTRMAYLGADYPLTGFDLGLDEMVRYDVTADTYPTGMQLVVVVVDEQTGVITLRNCWSVNDCGIQVNPMVVAGQIHGGLAQACGQALLEHVHYDNQAQLISGSFMDYAMPRADDLPSFGLDYIETPTANNPLGVKGVGEIGSNAGPAAIGNAIVDALWDLGVRHIDPPFTPFRVWSAIKEARARV